MSRLAALVRQSAFDPRPDGALLGAFLADRDEAAFAELVRRHAPLVWGACRRGLPDLADAEDAFQATFLVLVRRANRLTGSPTVGPWLYKVAAWTAGNLRRKNARRLARCRELSDEVPDPRPTPEPSFDLDAALLGLSERHRAALVLCCLEGLTHREAAGRLGCAEGTVSSLVSRGLAKLRARLAGRDPSAALAVAAAVLVPNSLSAVAARSAAAFRVLSAAAASPAVAELTEGVLRMFWVKKATAAGMAAFVLLTAGVGVGLGVRQVPSAVADDKPAPAGKKDATDGSVYADQIADLKRAMAAMKAQHAERERKLAVALDVHQATIDRMEKEAPLIPLLRKAEAASDRKEVDRLRKQIDAIRAAAEAKLPPGLKDDPDGERKLLLDVADPYTKQLLELEEQMEKLERRREELEAEARRTRALKDLDARTQPAGRRLVVSISGRRDKESLVITEYKDGNDTSSQYWTVTFSKANWTDADLDVVRDYLTRAASDKSVAREVKIVADKEAMAQLVKDLAKVCADAGFAVGMVELKPRDSGRVSPTDKLKLPANIQVVVPEDGAVTSGPEGTVITIPVGGIARLTMAEGKFVELNSGRDVPPGSVEGDVISPSLNADGVITIRGLKPSEGSFVKPTDDRGRRHVIRITVTAKGPGSP